MPQITCSKFGLDRLNGAKVEKRDRVTNTQTNVYFNRIVKQSRLTSLLNVTNHSRRACMSLKRAKTIIRMTTPGISELSRPTKSSEIGHTKIFSSS